MWCTLTRFCRVWSAERSRTYRSPALVIYDIHGSADSHEIFWFILRQNVLRSTPRPVHLLFRLAYRYPADSIPRQVERRDEFGAPLPQVLVQPALDDPEEAWPSRAEALHRSSQLCVPACGLPRILVSARIWRAFVEGHNDVRAYRAFDFHHPLRSEEML